MNIRPHPRVESVGQLLAICCVGFSVSCTAPDADRASVADPVAPVVVDEPGAGSTGERVVVTVLATNGADTLGSSLPLQGEWSFAAWVEDLGEPRAMALMPDIEVR